MEPQKKFTFPRVRESIRQLLYLLRVRRKKVVADFAKDVARQSFVENVNAAEQLNKDWCEWMETRYHNKWNAVKQSEGLKEAIEFMQIYLDDVRISKLEEIAVYPEKATELSQRAEGIRDAMNELLFLGKITEQPKMVVTMEDIH